MVFFAVMKPSLSYYEHIIWDWNGTLLDDKWLCVESINRMLQQRNLPPITVEAYGRIFDFPVRDYYAKVGFDFDREPYEIPALEFIELYHAGMNQCRLQPDAREVLEELYRKGCALYLLSASESGILKKVVRFHGIEGYFRIIKGLDNHYAYGKIDLGRELLQEIHPAAGKVIMIGDTRHDEEVATELGIPCILFDGGHFPRTRLEDLQSPIISNLKELLV